MADEKETLKDDQPIEDIFSDVSSDNLPLVEESAQEDIVPVTAVNQSSVRENVFKLLLKFNWITIIAFAVMLALLITGAWYYCEKDNNNSNNSNSSVLEDQNILNNVENGDSNNVESDINVINPKQQYIDTDHDGLSDEAENKYGTDYQKSDTDHDGLSDREEIKVYLTDPIVADTDEDGYNDGEEVKKGFNPLGQGYLIDWQKEINNKLNK